ncbi:MAG: hypothetical protein LJE96_13160 [Deltaproteobacteria bacterium]|nr:hypothetical protein [Deltaproteobacteria bacterium]
MKIAQSVRTGAWLLIALNLLMALGAIWIFMRMAPAIEIIIERNERSLEACEEMLAALAMISRNAQADRMLKATFENALKRAQNNITEKEEPAVLEIINADFNDAFLGDRTAQQKTVAAIVLLGKINREAMVAEDHRAKQFGNAGAWGMVFMSASVFFAGMLLKRRLSRNLVTPLEEIHQVMSAHRNGDNMRRCTGPHLPADVQQVYSGINGLLDRYQSQADPGKKVGNH